VLVKVLVGGTRLNADFGPKSASNPERIFSWLAFLSNPTSTSEDHDVHNLHSITVGSNVETLTTNLYSRQL
jgi:hypothetical protein